MHPLYAAGAAGFRLRLGGGRCAPLAEPQTEAGLNHIYPR